ASPRRPAPSSRARARPRRWSTRPTRSWTWPGASCRRRDARAPAAAAAHPNPLTAPVSIRQFEGGGVRPRTAGAASAAPGYWSLALLVAVALFLPGTGDRPLYVSDEARYALIARNMLETGHWLVPKIGSEVHLEKPPLFMWAIAGLGLFTGDVTERTAAWPAALSGGGGVMATVLLGRPRVRPPAAPMASHGLR